ncbi:magnesium transporter CorA family protein [Acinetobacter larvae]|uniref:Magnesium transporter n=1 Tax=Acinetobacter larvae TaxID=1789224 RepID=A0A1B2M2Z7_9GAMM|nr:magnesium transporter CorA family protein [Acinetobacter larvae]AOA59568.1 hypothetical protein BFG52_15260 [Acinetobacter larvae]
MFKTNAQLPLQHTRPTATPLWHKLIAPNDNAVQELLQQYKIPHDLLQHALTPKAMPRLQSEADGLLLICHLPFALSQSPAPQFQCQPVALIVTAQDVILCCAQEHAIFKQFFDVLLHQRFAGVADENTADDLDNHNAKVLNAATTMQAIYDLLRLITAEFTTACQQVNQAIALLEMELKQSTKNQQIFTLIQHGKTLNRVVSALEQNGKVLQQLLQQPWIVQHDTAPDQLLDVILANAQMHAMATTQNSNLCNLMDAYSAMVENNLSLLVQYLSIFVIIGAIPLGIASLYGMNTPLPLQEQPYSLALFAIISIVISSAMIMIFKKRQLI